MAFRAHRVSESGWYSAAVSRGDSTVARPVRQGNEDGPRVPCLQVLRAPLATLVIRLESSPLVIGRGDEAGLSIDDDGLSRRHAKVVIGDDAIHIVDLDSTNGTYVDGKQIEAAVLRDGARIQLGPDVILRFGLLLESAIEALERTEGAGIELSKRELEVAVLVARDLSNNDIARELGISPRTVTTHLSNIYDRLGVRSRVALTAYVYRRGLVGQPE